MTLCSVDDLIREYGGIRLDIACGASKQPGFVGIDVRPLPGVDIVHDLNVHPWPLPDGCCLAAMASHIVEHIPPVALRWNPVTQRNETCFPFMEFMAEVWRVLRTNGQFAIVMPYGGSVGYLQDPTHCNAHNEAVWAYFDPEHPAGLWAAGYRPKPWKINNLFWSPTGNIEVVLEKRSDVYV